MRIYSADYLVPISAPPLKKGGVLVKDEVILDTGDLRELKEKYNAGNIINFDGCALLPGLVNAHTHLELLSFKVPENPVKSMVGWITSIIPAKLSLTSEQKSMNIREGLEMAVKSGTTTIGDNLSWWDFLTEYADSPLSGVIFLEILGLYDEQVFPLIGKLKETVSKVPPGNFSFGFAPHSLYSVSDMLFEQVKILHEKFPLPVSIHLQESEDEDDLTYRGTGAFIERLYPLLGFKSNADERFEKLSSSAYLSKKNFFSLSPLTVHNCYVRENEIPLLFERNVKPLFCLRSNDTLGNRIPDLPAWLKLFGEDKIALGTDSLASVETLSMWDEMRFIKKVFPEISDEKILIMATLGGANALGLGERKGSIEPGKDADMIAVSMKDWGNDTKEIYSFMIDSCDESRLECIIIGGNVWKDTL